MKAKLTTSRFVNIGLEYGGISVKDNDVFSILMEELNQPEVKSIYVYPNPKGLIFEIECNDGWIISIRKGIYEKEHLVVTRFKRPRDGGILSVEYLTTNGDWFPEMKTWYYGPLPDDAMKIPAPKAAVENIAVDESMMEAEG